MKREKVERMPIAYIAGPYRSRWGIIGRIINILKARQTSIKLWQWGYAVICPHMNTALFDGKAPDDVWLKGDLEFIRRLHCKHGKTPSDVIYMMKDFSNSIGALKELELAKKCGLEVLYEE